MPDLLTTLGRALAALDQSEASLSEEDLCRWVIVTPGEQPLAFVVGDQSDIQLRPVQVDRATWFRTQREARQVASCCRYAGGLRARAMRVSHAYRQMRETLRNTLGSWPQFMPARLSS
ncbi:MAG: hypothetical protein V4792_13105 [Pseudomonadota bacterium]